MSQDLPDFNDLFRGGVMSLIDVLDVEGVPVGGFLGAIIGLLWPETDHSEVVWNSIKRYAEDLVKEVVDRGRIEGLNNRLAGFENVAKAYRKTSFGSPQKGQHLTSLLDDLRLFEKDFWDERNPEKMFPLFSVYGTLWITVLFEQAFMYKKVYQVDDPDAQAHLEEFRQNVKKYTDGAQAMFDNLYAWRFGLLQLTESLSSDVKLVGVQYDSTWTFTDKYDGFSQQDGRGTLNDSNFHNSAGLAHMEAVMADRVSSIRNNYVSGLQETLAVTQLWQYMEPNGLRPLKHYIISNQGPWGGDIDKGGDFVDQTPGISSRITSIKMRHGAFIDHLEVFHDGQPGGGHGNPNGGALSELQLADDEFIVEVSGRASSLIDHLKFTTNKGRSIEGGDSPSGTPFTARGREGWKNVSLFAVSGRSDGGRITGLNLQWKNMSETPDYIPSYQRRAEVMTPSSNVYLKTQKGEFVSNVDEAYSGRAASDEYFATKSNQPVGQQLRPQGGNGQTFSNKDVVLLWTSEDKAKDYPYLGRFRSSNLYYYSRTDDNKQLWQIFKMIPSDGPVLWGEKIYLRNIDEGGYIFAGDDQYLGTRLEPYAWEVVKPG